ncbi:YdaF family protein [Escherichia coli]|nr:YdaF family protein [Escherichia coli]
MALKVRKRQHTISFDQPSNQDGTFTAMTYTKSKTFKTETGARRWLEKHTVS